MHSRAKTEGNLTWAEVTAAFETRPSAVMVYLAHVEAGRPIRALARETGCHASTILRQVRRVEAWRDDPLIDQALRRAARLGRGFCESGGTVLMTDQSNPPSRDVARATMAILARLAETGAVMALADGMENAVVVRELEGGEPLRTAVVPRAIAEALAINGWIRITAQGRITRYAITAAGRAALEREAAEDKGRSEGEAKGNGRVRYSPAESPLMTLARRRDRDGQPFLTADLVRAGETLREDFELAQLGGGEPDWEAALSGSAPAEAENRTGTGPGAARARVLAALADLGPGLGDVVLRACCYLEGMESVEKRMGWAARSGKVVLRIALQRLLRHYDVKHGGVSPLIG